MAKISVKTTKVIDHTNAAIVTVDGEKYTVWTNETGRGLWVNGKQEAGTAEFSAGKNAAAAYRRYFSK